jgi:hypothetical protein
MINSQIEEKISHEKISISDLKFWEESAGNLESLANEELTINQTQDMIFGVLLKTYRSLTGYQGMIHHADLQNLQNLLRSCVEFNTLINNKLEDFLNKIIIFNRLNEKVKIYLSHENRSVKTPISNRMCVDQPEKKENKGSPAISITKSTIPRQEHSSTYDKFFPIACEIFKTRSTVGM